MPTIAELLGQAAAERLAAVRLEAGQREERAASAPVRPATCRSCGQPLPVPQAVFRSGAPGGGAGADVDPSRARV